MELAYPCAQGIEQQHNNKYNHIHIASYTYMYVHSCISVESHMNSKDPDPAT